MVEKFCYSTCEQRFKMRYELFAHFLLPPIFCFKAKKKNDANTTLNKNLSVFFCDLS